MAENRYCARQRQRKQRHRQWLFDEDMRLNDEIDRRNRRALVEKQRELQQRQRLLV